LPGFKPFVVSRYKLAIRLHNISLIIEEFL